MGSFPITSLDGFDLMTVEQFKVEMRKYFSQSEIDIFDILTEKVAHGIQRSRYEELNRKINERKLNDQD